MERAVPLLVFLVVACSSGSDGPTGRYVKGQVQSLSQRTDVAYFGNFAATDAVWAIPVWKNSIETSALDNLVVLPVQEDGTFLYTEDMHDGNYDILFALVQSSACANPADRAAWTESDLDERLECIQGFISIPDAESGESLTLMPISDQTSGVELGGVMPSERAEATSETTLRETSDSFGMGEGGLRAIAQTDNTLKGFAYLYANSTDDLSDFYNMHLLYRWTVPLAAANNAETSASALEAEGYYYSFDTNVAVDTVPQNEIGYVQLYPPGPVTIDEFGGTFDSDTPLVAGEPGLSYSVGDDARLGGGAGLFSGTSPEGEWKLRRGGDDGPIVSKYDLALSSPFASVDGELDVDRPLLYMPQIMVEQTDGAIQGVYLEFVIHDGSSFVDVPFEDAIGRIRSPSLHLEGDGLPGCPEEAWVAYDSEPAQVWTPPGNFVLGTAGDDTNCSLTSVTVEYYLMGSAYQFSFTSMTP